MATRSLESNSVAILARAVSCSKVRMISSIVGVLMVPALISTEWAIAHTMHRSKSSEMCWNLGPLVRGFTDCENHVRSISDAVGLLTSRITAVEWVVNTLSAETVSFAEMEQNIRSLTARMCKIETNAASASSGSGSARSWPSLFQIDGSTATGSSEEGRNTRCRLVTFSSTDDENARNAVLSRFPCEQCHTGVSVYLKKHK